MDFSKVTAMINDISEVDLGSIGSQAFYATTESEGQDSELNAECKYMIESDCAY